ncbi:MAG: RsmD family RNA methyltransferase [bacterium]|nr:RsmD family RNA methyltransferase [bacterium]
MPESTAASDLHEALIEALSTDGRGIARVGGHAVFVTGGLPGDRIELRILPSTTPVSAEIFAWIERSPQRIEHTCPHAERCVGSPWGSLIYSEQLHHKRELIERTLHKMLGDIVVEPVVPSPALWHYRNRVSLHVWPNGRSIEIGFRTSARQRDGVAVNTCSLAEQSVAAAIHSVNQKFAEGTPDDLPALPSRVQVHRTARGAGALFIFNGECEPAFIESLCSIFSLDILPGGLWFASGTQAGILRHNSPILFSPGALPMRTQSLGCDIHVHPAAFCQANPAVAMLVERDLGEWAGAHKFRGVWDLYGGFGALGLAAASHSLPLEVFEISPQSEPTLRDLAEHIGNRNVRFHRGDLQRTLPRHCHRLVADDLIILDPPRSGAHPDVLRLIGESSARAVVYLSCNPARLARDLAILRTFRFQPRRIRPYDFFPQTPAVEVLAILFR